MNVWFVLGTRPEMIKLAPVIKAAEKRFKTTLILTGQHPAVEKMSCDFGLIYRTNMLLKTSSLNEMVRKILSHLDEEAKFDNPDCVVVQGDTTSAMAAALWAFNRQIPVAHVEAGLRTYEQDPYPEEANRRIIAACTKWHFAPTPRARDNLLREGYRDVEMAGNTSIDALSMVPPELMLFMEPTAILTLHRRESWGDPMLETLKGIVEWLDTTDMQVVWPVHPGTATQGIAKVINHPRLIKVSPYDYFDFIRTIRDVRFLITDSGGIQEEAAALGKYTIVVRHSTERPEAIEAGIAVLAQPRRVSIRLALEKAEREWESVNASDVFGDGKAAERIVDHLSQCMTAL